MECDSLYRCTSARMGLCATVTMYIVTVAGLSFFRTGGRKWKKLISSAEDLEESGINGI